MVAGLLAAGYIFQRGSSGSHLASVIGGVGSSSVRYDRGDDTVTLMWVAWWEELLDVVMLYDADKVTLTDVSSPYRFVSEDDGVGIVRFTMDSISWPWSGQVLLTTTWSGALGSVVMSDVGVRQGDSYRTLRVYADDFCIRNNCHWW